MTQQIGIQVYDSSGIPFIRIGQFPNGNPAIKISQLGVDVTNALPTQLIFNSDVISGTFTFPVTPTINATSSYSTSGVVNHGLGYVPSFQTYTSYPNNPADASYIAGLPTTYYGPLLNNALYNDSNVVSSLLYVGVDQENLYFVRNTTNSDSSPHQGVEISIVYYIFQYGSATS